MWQPFTYGQKSWAFYIALKFGIKLIMYGENGELEYGGNDKYKHLPKEGIEEWESQYFRGNNVEKFLEIGLEKKIFQKMKFLKQNYNSIKHLNQKKLLNQVQRCIGFLTTKSGYLKKTIIMLTSTQG